MRLAPLLFLLAFAACLGGGVLIWWGRRGRRVGDRLYCRTCEYDLSGMPGGASRCPECGQFIRYGGPRGRIQPRTGPIRTGLSLLCMGLLTMAVILATEGGGLGWIEYKPLWYVTWEITHPSRGASQAAHLTELQTRIKSSKLDPAQLQGVIEAFLDYQANDFQDWSPAVGDLIESLRRDGKVKNADWQRYLTQGVTVRSYARKVGGRSGAPAVALYADLKRYGRSPFPASFQVSRVLMGSDELEFTTRAFLLPRQRARSIGQEVILNQPFPAGVHQVVVEYVVIVSETSNAAAGANPQQGGPGSPAVVKGSIPVQFQIHPEETRAGPATAAAPKEPDKATEAPVSPAGRRVGVSDWLPQPAIPNPMGR